MPDEVSEIGTAVNIAQSKEISFGLEILDGRITEAAKALGKMDKLAESFSVSEAGKIITPEGPQIELQDKGHKQTLNGLLGSFTESNNALSEKHRQDKNVIDAKLVYGAVIVTFDSSKGIPGRFVGSKDRGFYNGPSDFGYEEIAGELKPQYFLGEIGVDLNPKLRTDGVEATVSFRHEFRHHTTRISDYLITQDKLVGMDSAYRDGRKVALFGDSKDRMTTDQSFKNDERQYSDLLGRKMDVVTDQKKIENQALYLDELHSSFLQKKPNWIDAREEVYSYGGLAKGKHWELVGGQPQDVESTKKLLGYLQAIYLCSKMTTQFGAQETVGEGQNYLIERVLKLFYEAGSLVGAARTVVQAERLIADVWDDFAKDPWTKKLLTNETFSEWVKDVLATGWGAENLPGLIREKASEPVQA